MYRELLEEYGDKTKLEEEKKKTDQNKESYKKSNHAKDLEVL